MCTTREAANQHAEGQVELHDGYWPYVKAVVSKQDGNDAVAYVEQIRRLLAARKCVLDTFNPADEKFAMELFRQQVEIHDVEHAILLACARRYVSLLNGTVVGRIAGLRYFHSAIEEVRGLKASEDYWRYLASRVAQFERQCLAG